MYDLDVVQANSFGGKIPLNAAVALVLSSSLLPFYI